MSFRFSVRKVTKVAGVIAVDGIVESGTLRHGVTAVARTSRGDFPVMVKTVALIDPPKPDRTDRTLTIAPPEFQLELLEGATLVCEE